MLTVSRCTHCLTVSVLHASSTRFSHACIAVTTLDSDNNSVGTLNDCSLTQPHSLAKDGLRRLSRAVGCSESVKRVSGRLERQLVDGTSAAVDEGNVYSSGYNRRWPHSVGRQTDGGEWSVRREADVLISRVVDSSVVNECSWSVITVAVSFVSSCGLGNEGETSTNCTEAACSRDLSRKEGR